MAQQEIIELIKKSIKDLQREKIFPEFEIPEVLVEHPEESIHGDYAVNIALKLSKKAKKKPIEIAELIKSSIMSGRKSVKAKKKNLPDFFEKIEVAKPGFINFFISKEYLQKELLLILKEKDKYGSSRIGKGKTVVIDYSSPNIAKPFGIGHLRSTIIGQALYNIYKFLGWKCIGDNHLGDWGTQFGKLIYQIKKERLENKTQKEKAKILKGLTIGELEKLYVDFHKQSQDNPELDEEARSLFKKLEQGDEEAKEIWQACRDISLKEFDKIYKILGVKIDHTLGESFYLKMFKGVVKEAIKKKIAVKSRGALIIKYSADNLPAGKAGLPPSMLLKSDGATTYLTRDLATIKYRLKYFKPTLFIYEIGADQSLYLKQLFLTAKLLGWINKERLIHVSHGLVRWKYGKFSTRKGKTIHLEEVLEESIKRAREIIKEPALQEGRPETGRGLSKREKNQIARIVGIGAVKYNDLSQHHIKDIVFDWNKILNLKGNSAPYLQYTYARCQSVLKKSKTKPSLQGSGPCKLKTLSRVDLNKEEENILRIIYKFPEVVQEAGESFSPNLICNFAFDLAQKYNLFYGLHPVIKAKIPDSKIFRLSLTASVAQVLKNSLNLMGISVPKRM